MSLTPGTRLGPYEIVSAIGAGGMGEVYRAKDTKLNRDVAIKVLPESFALDADRVARFTREAQVLASLNHPNIAAIYGLEGVGSVRPAGQTRPLDDPSVSPTGETRTPGHALVMELVEGEDLSAHIARGAIPLAEALPIAKQIADALEAAHEQGIVHRDLKPQNLKVRADGTVKVLDFGLAKALAPDGASASADAMNSPTLTARATQMGMIIGTAAYMAPEQARGKVVDRRADIWAFGVVVYEMLTGTRAFPGDDITDTLAAVVRAEPDWSLVPRDLSPTLLTFLKRCLQKDPKQRLGDIHDMRLALDGAFDTAPASASVTVAPSSSTAWRLLPWALAAAMAAVVLGGLAIWAPWRSTPAPTPRRLLASIGADASLQIDRSAAALLSPDGATLAFVAQQEGQTRLFVRRLSELQAVPVAGTEGANYAFFSPNGEWIGFFAGGKLKKVAVTGSAAMTLCNAESGRGGTWSDDDTIIFSPSSENNTTLFRVPAAGGTPAAFGTLSPGATTQRWPDALPGGKAVLYTENSGTSGFETANIVVASVSADASAKGGPSKVVVPGAYYGRYVPSGHLLYVKQGTLFAVPFDPVRLETTGPGVPAIEGLTSSPSSGGAQVAFSSEGTLAYVPGAAASPANPIDWMTREGKTSVLRATKAEWVHPRFSPDGRKLVLQIDDAKQRHIWVYDWALDTPTQLTFGSWSDSVPVWTPDGKRIVFASDRAKPGGHRNLYWVNADGTGEVTRLTDSPDDQRPMSWHPSGKFLAFHAARAATGTDLMILPMDGDPVRGWTPGTPTVFLATPNEEFAPMFSPDGRFIAYFSNEASGTNYDVYVRPFPGPSDSRWRVSTETLYGVWPRWSPTARELLFESGGKSGDKILFAPFAVVGDAFVPGKPQPWSTTSINFVNGSSPYDIHPDGKRLAVLAIHEQTVVPDKLVFVFNFFDYLRKIAPVKK